MARSPPGSKVSDTTGREDIARADLEVWFDNPVLGVGPGVAKEYRAATFGRAAAAHTEFTRLLAEHGILGLVALIILYWHSSTEPSYGAKREGKSGG